MSNRLAHLMALRPNTEFFMMGRPRSPGAVDPTPRRFHLSCRALRQRSLGVRQASGARVGPEPAR
jgi:hypothetical protein